MFNKISVIIKLPFYELLKKQKDIKTKILIKLFMSKEVDGKYLKDAVYGASDGIVTTFAVVAGVAGASLDAIIVLILGFANLIADGFSMAAANYLGSKSQLDYNKSKLRKEKLNLDSNPRLQKNKIKEIYYGKGFRGKLLDDIINKITSSKKLWSETITIENLGITKNKTSPKISALITFLAFLIAGFMPLLIYILANFIPYLSEHTFYIASIITGLTFIVVGILKSRVSKTKWYKGALEMLLIGGGASIAAYFIGYFISTIV